MAASLPVKKGFKTDQNTSATALWTGGGSATAGNKLVAFNSVATTTPPATPTGWTLLQQRVTANSFTLSVYAKKSVGNELGITITTTTSVTHETHLYEFAGLNDDVTHLRGFKITELTTAGTSVITLGPTDNANSRKSAVSVAFWAVTGANMGTTTMDNGFSLTDGINDSAARGVSGVKVLTTKATQSTTVDWTNNKIGQGIIVIFDEEPVSSGATNSISDNFNDNTTNTTLWEDAYAVAGGSFTEANGRVKITPGGVFGSGYQTYDRYTLTGSTAHVEVVKHPIFTGGDGTTAVDTEMVLVSNTALYRVRKRGTNLVFVEVPLSTNVEDTTSITFDPVAHRWWRLTESGGNVLWQTSPDGLTWTTRRTKAPVVPLKPFSISLIGNRTGTAPTSFTQQAEFDNFNVVPNPTTASISDNFDDSSINTSLWGSNSGTVTEVSGKARVSTLSTPSAYATDEVYNLENSEVRVEVAVPATGTGTTEAFLSAQKDNTNFVMIVKRGTNIIARRNVAGTITETSVPYVAANMRQWKIREDGTGTIFFETSPTGLAGTYTAITSVASPIDVTAVNIRLGSVFTGAEIGLNPAFADFDNLNLDPPASSPQTITTPTGVTSTASVFGNFVVTRGGVTISTVGGVTSAAPTFGLATITVGSPPTAPGVPTFVRVSGAWTNANLWLRSGGAWVTAKAFVRKNGQWVGDGPPASTGGGFPADTLFPSDTLFPGGP